MIATTNHFDQRIKQRAGIKKGCSKSFFEKAVNNGLYLEDFMYRPTFYAYLKNLVKGEYVGIVYNRHIIITNNDDVAITILDLPKEYYSVVDSVKKKREMESHDKRTNNSG